MTDSIRTWLIAALTQEKLSVLDEADWPELLALAEADGVLVLLAHQLARHPAYSDIPAGLLSQIQEQAKLSLMEQLPFQSGQKNLFRALSQAQIPFLVMKGAALGNWLYDAPSLRPVTDIDLWFSDSQTVFSLDEILRPLGYTRAESAGGLSSFEQAFDKDLNGRKIRLDAHWAMFNCAMLSDAVGFDAAYARAQSISIQNEPVKALCLIDALINSIGHRALKHLVGQADTLKWLYDQYLLFNALDAAQWQGLVESCAEAGISDLALEAMERSQRLFNTRIPPQVVDALAKNAGQETIKRNWFQSWPRYQWHEMLAVSPKFSGRAAWLGQRLWPNPEAMRARYGNDDPAWKFMLRRIGTGLKRLLP